MQFLFLCLFLSSLVSNCLIFSEAIDCQINTKSPSGVAYTVTVSTSGTADFRTVQAAINSIPDNNDRWIKVLLSPGIYKEKVLIPQTKTCLFLEGQSLHNTVIQFDDHVPRFSLTVEHETASVWIMPDNFIAKGITFENNYNVPALQKLVKHGGSKVVPFWSIAVAARVDGDKASFYDCGFISVQDTLFDSAGRHFFNSCYIEGAVDFIFGNGQSVYSDSSLKVSYSGVITAQSRGAATEPTGFLFLGGHVLGAGPTYLGRAWRQYARVIYRGTIFDNIINPLGWDAWGQQAHVSDFTYVEYECHGPGANLKGRVPWMRDTLTQAEQEMYTINGFINQDQWIEKQPSH